MTIRYGGPARPVGLACLVGFPFALLAMGCGSSGSGNFLDVGSDDAATLALGPGAEGGASGGLDAHIEQKGITVTFVRVGCSASCADVEAVATGGTPPYSYAWTDGPAGATRTLCPTSTTAYSVTVTDTGSSGEQLGRGPETAKATVTADVMACPDGGVDAGSEIDTNCDDLAADFAPAGANPNKAWSYGWTATVGGAFTIYPQFIAQDLDAGPFSTNGFPDIAQWFDPANGVVEETGPVPDIQYNPLPMTVSPGTGNLAGSSWLVAPGQIVMAPLNDGTTCSVARWTAPAAGTYGVKATFASTASTGYSQTSNVHVQHDSADLPSGSGAITTSVTSFPFYATVVVAGGDTIDFVVAPDSALVFHMTSVDAQVCRGGGP